MADNVKLVGNINVGKMSNVGVMTIQGQTCAKKCLVIPIEENDVFVKVEEKTTRDGRTYTDKRFCIGIEVYEAREQDQYGNTHYVKLSTSKEFINSHTQARAGCAQPHLSRQPKACGDTEQQPSRNDRCTSGAGSTAGG